MSKGTSPFGYNFYDFLTRIVPGLTIILPFYVGYLSAGTNVNVNSRVTLIFLGLIALVFGELIDLFRSTIFRVPSPFKEIIYYHTHDEDILSKWDKADLWLERRLPEFIRSKFLTNEIGRKTIFEAANDDFRNEYENHFNLDFNSNSTPTLYSTFLNYMDTKMTSRTRRYYTLRAFSQNLMAATIFMGLSTLYVAIQNLENTPILGILLISIVILSLLFELALVFSSVSYPLVDLLIIDYYLDRLSGHVSDSDTNHEIS